MKKLSCTLILLCLLAACSPTASPTAAPGLYEPYLGTWYADAEHLDECILMSAEGDAITFYLGIFRTAGITATTMTVNGELRFGPLVSPYYTGPNVSGVMTVSESGVRITVESSFDAEQIPAGTVYTFTIRDTP